MKSYIKVKQLINRLRYDKKITSEIKALKKDGFLNFRTSQTVSYVHMTFVLRDLNCSNVIMGLVVTSPNTLLVMRSFTALGGYS